MREIHTSRLYLKQMEQADAGALYSIWSDPAVTAFMNISAMTDVSQAMEMIGLLTELERENKAVRFTVRDRKSKDIIGSIGFNTLDFDNERAEVGYDISKSHWGKGFAGEAIAGMMEYGFGQLGLNRIEAKVEPDNNNSIRVLEKLRFTLEGTLRQYEKINGKFVDYRVYSKLKADE
ncbi:GNAT family N-acetyltransferase [Paenibacillus chungangensis]|uniref:GNAT family N-acetyltransferase n=1 Tax=Paenibacillus chungangensis TaxID=696535 RepID=A0ABW3HTE0_9BACL